MVGEIEQQQIPGARRWLPHAARRRPRCLWHLPWGHANMGGGFRTLTLWFLLAGPHPPRIVIPSTKVLVPKSCTNVHTKYVTRCNSALRRPPLKRNGPFVMSRYRGAPGACETKVMGQDLGHAVRVSSRSRFVQVWRPGAKTQNMGPTRRNRNAGPSSPRVRPST